MFSDGIFHRNVKPRSSLSPKVCFEEENLNTFDCVCDLFRFFNSRNMYFPLDRLVTHHCLGLVSLGHPRHPSRPPLQQGRSASHPEPRTFPKKQTESRIWNSRNKSHRFRPQALGLTLFGKYEREGLGRPYISFTKCRRDPPQVDATTSSTANRIILHTMFTFQSAASASGRLPIFLATPPSNRAVSQSALRVSVQQLVHMESNANSM